MNPKSKTKATIFAIMLTFAMIASSLFAISPTVDAQATQNYPTFLYAAVAPNPVGVGQPVIVVTWTAEMPPDIGEINNVVSSPSGRAGWSGMTMTITDPDGNNETVNLPYTDPVGTTYYSYTPDTVGNYSFVVHFPDTWKNSSISTTAVRQHYAAADSAPAILTVQTEQLVPVSGVPLPNDYWTRPIYAYNRDWALVAGNWMTGLRDLPFISAPSSAHIAWTAPYGFGGIAGGNYSGAVSNGAIDYSYHTGSAYENKFADPQIINGWLFYTQALEDSVTTSHTQIIARDLRTGQIYWTQNATATAGSSIYDYESPNQHGLHPYLWTSGKAQQALSPGVTPPANTVVDPFTGAELFNYINVPTGTWAVGANGERMQIVFGGGTSTNRTWMALWNSSAIPSMLAGTSSTSYWQYRPVGKQHNGTQGYSWNVSLPAGIGTTYQVYVFDDRVISGTGFVQFGTSAYHENFTAWSISLKPENRGSLMWKISPKPPAANVTLQWCAASVADGVLVLRAKETMQYVGYDINTGEYLWTTESQPAWMMYSSGADIQKGILYAGGYGGQVFAYDVHTGDLLWTANTDREGLESAYDMTPLTVQVVDGKVYARSQEHSHTQPLYRTWKIYCFNGTTGDRMWDLNGYWSAFAFSDGYGVSLNGMDNQVYSIGKGPTAITASVANDVTTYGSSVLITGTVMDTSAGTQSSGLKARFPDGVPAVSEDSMTDWMQYVYQQMPKPSNASGVVVNVNVIDDNGNFRPIGQATTDASGFYSLAWTPDIEGKFTVIASFDGSPSYWRSQAETAFNVDAAAATPTQQPAAPQSQAEMYVLGAAIAIIIAIAIVGVVILMAVKKRP